MTLPFFRLYCLVECNPVAGLTILSEPYAECEYNFVSEVRNFCCRQCNFRVYICVEVCILQQALIGCVAVEAFAAIAESEGKDICVFGVCVVGGCHC